MADPADITGNNDFTEEKLKLQLHKSSKETPLQRGKCLFCGEPIRLDLVPVPLYCNDDCRADFEREQMILSKTKRMITKHGMY